MTRRREGLTGRERGATRQGWRGRLFEDFEPGDVYEHPLGRTVTQADNIWFTLLTVNTNPVHFDAAYAAAAALKQSVLLASSYC